jgi:hypothetical protein
MVVSALGKDLAVGAKVVRVPNEYFKEKMFCDAVRLCSLPGYFIPINDIHISDLLHDVFPYYFSSTVFI